MLANAGYKAEGSSPTYSEQSRSESGTYKASQGSGFSRVVNNDEGGPKQQPQAREIVNKEAPKTQNQNPYSRPGIDKSFCCGKPGHKSKACPERRPANLAGCEELNEEEESLGEPQDEEYGVCAPDGEDEEREKGLFVVRSLMLTPKKEEESQRHSLFQTRCTINNQIF
ncbi:hypothetical protein CFOL_v3_32857 [Cephalotus follicularis]|uniref:CCHC-type domain-containing protein n=1 Tax=Cephalotus follicularis TaxID=3775 RepID=A0A1Q3DAV1_CEPFO|nr:hypothetical protein CFOL_v3_32857 [Cephalotus follicularis]